MKKKYIAIIIAVVILVAIFTFGQVFTVKTVDVVFENDTAVATDAQIVNLAGVEHDKNIFSFKEDDVIELINEKYNNALKVSIERIFPNKVIIKIKERIPMFVLEVNNANYSGFIATDKDFQRTDKIDTESMDNLILIRGYTVKSSFDTEQCRNIRILANTLIDAGMKYEAVSVFIDQIYFNGSEMVVQIAQYDAQWTINGDGDVTEQAKSVYKQFLNTSPVDRIGRIFIAG